jgi:hypothetical protein
MRTWHRRAVCVITLLKYDTEKSYSGITEKALLDCHAPPPLNMESRLLVYYGCVHISPFVCICKIICIQCIPLLRGFIIAIFVRLIKIRYVRK